MRIVILSPFPFPYGMAVTNRLISYAQGLAEASNVVDVLCLKPTENENRVLNFNIKGVYKSVNFKYTSGNTVISKNRFKRLAAYFIGFIAALIVIYKTNRKDKIKSVIVVGPLNPVKTITLFITCKLLGIKLLQERSEYPFITSSKSILFKINLFLYLNISCKLYDGTIVITEALRDYFQKKGRKNAKTYLLPMLVEPERFVKRSSTKTLQDQYIAYCGSMEGDKDGVPDLITAFKIMSEQVPEIKLYMIGGTQFNGFKEIANYIESIGLTDRIVFTGRIERDELPEYLSNASALALARPANKQAEGGFPTKLGEYLATGNPVVVTSVGEIPNYLTDGVNAFIAEPGNPNNFAKKLIQVFEDKNLSDKVGKNGQQLAMTDFNYKVQSALLSDFLNEM
jgi:glycosyltransferase involved in cell wall biosynthesis